MRAKALVLLLSLSAATGAVAQTIGPRLESMLARSAPGEPHLAWVSFRDKGDVRSRLAEAESIVSERALERRARRGTSGRLRVEDIPPLEHYVEAVRERVSRVRHVSRWLNAVSVEATPREIEELSRLPFVAKLEAVRRYRKGADELVVASHAARALRDGPSAGPIDYGTSFGQLEQIGVPALHDMGLDGTGIVIAVLDSGFKNLRHPALAHLDIKARWDFVNGDQAVGNHGDRGDGDHGGIVLSVVGGYAEGELVGPAYRATFLLAKTEDTWSETPVEEDNWAAAAEWAESLGADVISTSLGYLDFDFPFADYTYADLDGRTAVTTRAAQMAAELGVVVVTSAGNGGFHDSHNTLGAPADGELVLAIGAVDSFGMRADFSSVGRTADGRIKPDVMAQGVLVKGIDPDSPTGYVLADGTSFACPLAAGVAALLLQAHPDWNVHRVRTAFRSTAGNRATPTRLIGWGIIDALAAVSLP